MNIHSKLFSDFSNVVKEQWKLKAIEDLKGGDFDKKLVWKTDEGFNIQPFYTAEDRMEINALQSQQHISTANDNNWISYVDIKTCNAKTANELALEMKKAGAKGFLFNIQEDNAVDFNSLLDGLDVAEDHISFSLPKPSLSFIKAYFNFVESKKIDLAAIKGFVETDILERMCLDGSLPDFHELAEVVRFAKCYPGFKTLVIRSHAFVNSGANATQELAFTLNKLTDIIDQLLNRWITPKEILGTVMFHMAIGGDYFFEISKLRALKILLANILPLYCCNKTDISIISSNAVWSKSSLDPNVNLLRNTTEAMSAVLGGCNALLVYPHDSSYRGSTKFSQRIALNISNLLKEESYFNKVIDPSAGSYYIETLTNNLASSALDLFKEIEEEGGFVNCYKSGSIQERIKKIKELKEKAIISRKRVYVGSNRFPDQTEKSPLKTQGIKRTDASFPMLVPQHATKLFEELKNKTLTNFSKTGFLPKVYPACFGDLAMRKARSTFAGDFLGTAGFEILSDFFFDDAQKAAEESARSTADIVVMCSSDAEYETDAVNFVEKFRSINKDKLLVLAGYPETLIDHLKAAGVDAFIHMRSNIIDVLSEIQVKLKIKD